MKKRNPPDPMIFKKHKPTGQNRQTRNGWQRTENYRRVTIEGIPCMIFTDTSGRNTVVKEPIAVVGQTR